MSGTPDATRRPAWLLPAAYVVLGAILVGIGGVSFERANRLRFDFKHFYLDAQYVWAHGALNPVLEAPENPDTARQLPFYLPGVSVLIAPVAFAGPTVGALLWALTHVVSFAVVLWIVAGWLEQWRIARRSGEPDDALIVVAVTCLFALPAIYEAAKFNQLSYIVLALMVLGIDALRRERGALGGFWLGLATLLKILPGIFIVWLVLKRRWLAAIVALGTFVVVDLGASAAVFGPELTVRYHRQWFEHNRSSVAGSAMLDTELAPHFIDRRNQSIPAVIARWTRPEHPERVAWQPITLTRAQAKHVGQVLLVVALCAFLVATGRRWQRLPQEARDREAAAYLLAMMIFAPLTRQYYLIWAFPALAIFGALAGWSRTRRQRRRGWTGIAVWIAGMILWTFPEPRVMGAHLLMLIVLTVVLLSGGRRGAVVPTQ